MSFIDWLYSSYPNPSINGQWGWLHIVTLVLCIGIIIAISLIFNKCQKLNNPKAKKIVLWVAFGLILFFELARRIINLCKTTEFTFNGVLHTLLPRPWCAISCWVLMASVIVNKKFFYNFASITSLLCTLIFFAYPGVGFNNELILFENLYSIVTHSLLLITSICMITLGFTDFRYKTAWKELICLVLVFIYAILEIYVLKIEDDPLYFMRGNDVQEIFGVGYGAFLAIYIVFMVIYTNAFYLIQDRKFVFSKFKRKKELK